MSDDTTVRDVFTDIDPDPDAVLEECSGASLDDLLEGEGDGAHDPVPDDELDVDDTMASELFADLEAADATATDADETPDRPSGVDEPERVGDGLEFEFVGDSDVTVRDDGDVIDASAAELSAVASDRSQSRSLSQSQSAETSDSAGAVDAADGDAGRSGGTSRTLTVRDADGLELVGPDPTPTRVANETFSTGAFEG